MKLQDHTVPDIRRAKQQLRKTILGRLSGMTAAGRTTQSKALVDALQGLPEIDRAVSVMAFWPMKLEPDLSTLLDRLVARGVQVALPFITRSEPASVAGGPRMVARPYQSADALVTNHWGIREPTGLEIRPDSLDIILIPAVAISRTGDRLGHGRAYYDEYLLTATSARLIAPVFREQLVDWLPVEGHDRPVDLIITPDEVIRTKSRA
ncbi:MAG: 5-formyltetrahydrofolate cyclo-ligase [Rhodothermales bacterium]|jgi:5-formyltetrahydrofolate cyclo-ligase